jgi:hypothetical protein
MNLKKNWRKITMGECFLCKKKYVRNKWLLKHVQNLYPDEEWSIINDKVMKKGDLRKYAKF